MSKRKALQEMTTIKVTKGTAAIISVTVKRLRNKGQKTMTADKLLRDFLEERFPEAVKFVESGSEFDDEEIDNEESEE